ncbi:hypothetical protein [Flavobacterium sp. CAU 1735]|uniref:hypothetical protein n=1 Tax=Flavobacterium sp. CAU 1735 TaxID=3140361 RepID=UPI003260B952
MLEVIGKIINIIKINLSNNGYTVEHSLALNDNDIAYVIKLTIPLNTQHYILSVKIINDDGNPNVLYRLYVDDNVNLGYFDSQHYENLNNERKNINTILYSIIENNKFLFLGT